MRGSAYKVPAVLLASAMGCSSPTQQALPQFVDVASQAGLHAEVTAGASDSKGHILEANTGGVALLDYDRDGDLDIYYVNGWRFGLQPGADEGPSAHLYRNDGELGFSDQTFQAGVGYRGWGMGCAAWDADGDGWMDLFVTAAGPDRYYQNQTDGTFVTGDGANFGALGWSTGMAAADYDGDGDVDVYVAGYVELSAAEIRGDWRRDEEAPAPCTWRGVPAFCGPVGLPGARDILQIRNAVGAFQDRSDLLRPRPAYYGLGAVAGDFDMDGDADIYVADDSTPNLLYRNDDTHFFEIAEQAGVAVSADGRQQAGMGIASADLDGDGGVDLVVTNFSHDHVSVYTSQIHKSRAAAPSGAGSWLDVSYGHEVGRATLATLGWGVGLVDFDSDADLDLFIANGHVYPGVGEAGIGTVYHQANQIFRNDGGQLHDVSRQSGEGLKVAASSRGAAFGDLDNDGDVDIVVVNLDDAPSLLRNDGGNRQNWLAVELIGRGYNRSGIGGRVEVTTLAGMQWRERRSGTGYLSQDDHRLHFGLAAATSASVRVRWPDGQWQDLGEVASRQYLLITRDDSEADAQH